MVREATDGSLRLSLMHWRLVPGWTKEPGEGLFNARTESVKEKSSFPVNGFYKWQKVD